MLVLQKSCDWEKILRCVQQNVFKLLFMHVTNEGLLDRCKKGSNQNANESFNTLVWSLSLKEKYNSMLDTSFSVSLVVCFYNNNMECTLCSLIKLGNTESETNMFRQSRQMNEEKIYRRNYKSKDNTKLKWKLQKSSVTKKQDAFQHNESIQYQSQTIHI